jgi:hypothetical protein
MSVKELKEKVIQELQLVNDEKTLSKILQDLQISHSGIEFKRNPGFAKDWNMKIAPDFNETPEGFEEYMP